MKSVGVTLHLRSVLRGTVGRALLVGIVASLVSVSAAWAQDPNVVLDFCVDNPDRCALSVVHLSDGWELHYNADRPQVTASTFKIFALLAYADAVSRGEIDPNRVVTLDEWGSLWAGFDGGSLDRAYDRLGMPASVTLDELAGAMMRESDNAATDLLLDILGPRAAARSIKRWVPGFHDVPRPINLLFATFDNNPDDPFIGHRVIEDYSGFESAGYQRELSDIFVAMHDPLYVQQIRQARCQFPPWETPPANCTPDFHNGSDIWSELNNRFFMRATTRSYVQVLKEALQGRLFPKRMQEVVERHLEWRMAFPGYSDFFNRYGAKGGSLFPRGVLNWSTYLDSKESGDQVVVSIQLRRTSGGGSFLRAFAEEVARNPAFAEQVRNSFAPDPQLPEISARITEATADARGKGKVADVRVDVLNTSPFPAHSRSEVRLYASDDNLLDAGDALLATTSTPALVAYGTRQVRLASSAKSDPGARFLIVVVDANDEIEEGDEDNNVAWERVGP